MAPLSVPGTNKFGWILWVMSNIKVFAMQDGQPAHWLNMTDDKHPHITHMDQKATYSAIITHAYKYQHVQQ